MRKRIVDRWRTGGYGTTMWHHELECGHVFSKRRRLDKEDYECIECEALRELPPEEPGVDVQDLDVQFLEEFSGFDPVASAGYEESRIAAAIAAKFEVDQGAVRVFFEAGSCAGVLIFLDPVAVARHTRV